jgi:hypothetical protein
MSFVVPERKRPSYAALTRALGVGTLVSGMVAVVALQVATRGEGVSPVAVALLAVPLSVPGGVWLTRVVLQRHTGYAMPWWIALVGVVASWVATPWAGAWLTGEILSGTFGGDDADAPPAPTAAHGPLDFQTGLAYLPPPTPVAPPPVDLVPEPEPLAALRLVAAPPVEALPPVAEPVAAAPAPEPVAAFPLPEAPPASVEAAAPAAPAPPPEATAPAYEPDPEPTPVAAPTEPALAEAAPVVVEHAAPLHALPPLEEAETPFFLPPSDLQPAAAGDPFAAFWLDPEAPSPEGLTPGYLPPLTGMWRTPLGDKL